MKSPQKLSHSRDRITLSHLAAAAHCTIPSQPHLISSRFRPVNGNGGSDTR